jgi:hypothetical protein
MDKDILYNDRIILFEKFKDQCLISFERNMDVEVREKILSEYEKIFKQLSKQNLHAPNIFQNFQLLTDFMLNGKVPYIIFLNAILSIQNMIFELLIERKLQNDVYEFMQFFILSKIWWQKHI